MAFALTEEQSRAVHDRGGGLLVSAAAGSGKTRVLVERLLDQVTGEGADIDDFLVITYTRAAAAELRARIAQELSDRLAERPNDRHLRRQTTLVYKAQISTVHAFCAALLRESGHQIGLDPDFRLCDEGEGAVLMARVLGETLDRQYEDLDPEGDFAALVDTMAAGRDDSRLEQIVLDVFGRIQSHPDPAGWLADQSAPVGAGWGHRRGGHPLGRAAAGRRQAAGGALPGAAAPGAGAAPAGTSVLSQNYGPSLSQSIQGVRALSGGGRGWDGVYRALPVAFPAAGRKKGVEDLEAAERVKGLRTRCKKQMDKLVEDLGGDSGQLLADLARPGPAVRGLMEPDGPLSGGLRRGRRRAGACWTFPTWSIWPCGCSPGTGTEGPARLARYWSGRFAEVMVDEYQDTNQVQNAIFTAVSDGRAEAVHGGGREAVHLPLPPGRPHHLPGQVPPLSNLGTRRRRGRSGQLVALPATSAPGRRCWRGPTTSSEILCQLNSGSWTTPRTRPSAPGAAFPPDGRLARWSWTLVDLSCLGDQEEGGAGG